MNEHFCVTANGAKEDFHHLCNLISSLSASQKSHGQEMHVCLLSDKSFFPFQHILSWETKKITTTVYYIEKEK